MVSLILYDVLFTTKRETMATNLTTFNATGKRLIAVLSDFTEQEWNTIPFEGSWTPAQVADHIRQSMEGALEAAQDADKTVDREQNEKVPEIQQLFLDFTIKMEAPEFVLPADQPMEKAAMIAAIEQSWNALIKLKETKDLSLVYTAFEFPGFGELTAFEWLAFCEFHTQRHTRQLENISDILTAGH